MGSFQHQLTGVHLSQNKQNSAELTTNQIHTSIQDIFSDVVDPVRGDKAAEPESLGVATLRVGGCLPIPPESAGFVWAEMTSGSSPLLKVADGALTLLGVSSTAAS
jgi:hypothetical protein